MRLRLFPAAIVLCVCAAAQQTLSIDQLASFIRSSLQLKYTDRQIASYLSKVRLSESLDERTIEDLQGQGAGPRTLDALRQLRDASAKLPKPKPVESKPAPPPIPPPSSEEQGKVLNEVRDYAQNYIRSLPDFICTQVTRRYVDPRGQDSWIMQDVVTAQVSYADQRENYKLVMVNDRAVMDRPLESLGGTTSTGEFGSMLRDIFSRKSETSFDWDHWATLRGKRSYVFSYRVPLAASEYRIQYERMDPVVVGYHGLIYVDKQTEKVLRITLQAEDIPPAYPVQAAGTVLDYDYTKIGDRDYLLPLKAVVRLRHDRYMTRNEVEFRLYRKFGAEATITFTPDPLPEDQTKEQPVK